ncbi:MAG TPA: NRDE family protein [Verrucomicrobiae bacterium]|nr:NRDE family protein [Verrucomicrobiae bacterium]
MCTVTFMARKNGFALGMNRDEKLSRARALPPQLHSIHGRHALFPFEPGGGTWVGVNDAGVGLALINWYAISTKLTEGATSRGEVVKMALAADSMAGVGKALAMLPLGKMNAFRLIGFFPAEGRVKEWRWNLHQLQARLHGWETNTWISSGFDELGAQKSRSDVFSSARQQISAGNLYWLRRLHRSHRPVRGAYSTCVHREDAATVSYTEMIVSPHTAKLHYQEGAPCCKATFSECSLKRI